MGKCLARAVPSGELPSCATPAARRWLELRRVCVNVDVARERLYQRNQTRLTGAFVVGPCVLSVAITCGAANVILAGTEAASITMVTFWSWHQIIRTQITKGMFVSTFYWLCRPLVGPYHPAPSYIM